MDPSDTPNNSLQSEQTPSPLKSDFQARVLRLDQPVPPEVEALLATLRETPSALSRRDAAHALGQLPESNERITAALILAHQADKDKLVRAEAAAVLKLPAQQAVLERDPAWVEEVLALAHSRHAKAHQEESRKWLRAMDILTIFGMIVAVLGGAALVLSLAGQPLAYLGVRLDDPLWNAVILVVGLALAGYGIREKFKG